ncbi:MAG: glutamine-hydrolyzing carbamoyl-phosphate synthase small subunit [Chloroflexi bacterium]|nr:glutamine-hydrolyzing carbamoyl-phosphate synthase small subunit [Chloroflexota bacterium]
MPPYLEADACLALEDGRIFLGRAFGARADAEGEVVFNTSMAGYQEIATDPSYHGQMVVLTYPQVGNYGVQWQAAESRRPWIAALIVRDLAESPSHWLAAGSLDAYLTDAGVPGIQRVDTRALTRHLRTHGALRAILGQLNARTDLAEQVRRLTDGARRVTPLSDKNLVAETSDPAAVDRRTPRPTSTHTLGERPRIAVVDCGVKHNIARSLAARGAEVIAVPWAAAAGDVLAMNPHGVVISNGPGDPQQMGPAVQLARELLAGGVPALGICLGHQVFGIAAGGTTSRLKFGHHGGNHPVRDLTSGRVHITSQNHEFQVDAGSIPYSSGFFVSMTHLNDGSVEGLAHRELPAFSVQYHPEGCPGPQDNQYIFERFLRMVIHPISGADALAADESRAEVPVRRTRLRGVGT